MKLLAFLALLAFSQAQPGKHGKAQAQASAAAPVAAPAASTPSAGSGKIPQVGHVAEESTEPATVPRLINAVTDWIAALALGINTVQEPGYFISNHHHARWIGLTSECMYKALSANTNKDLTDDDVAAYAAHQFLSYNFPQFQSAYFDALLNVYLDFYSGPYPHRAALDALVLPIVRRILVRETGRGMANFVQNYVAPNTIGVDRATLQKYEGHYQYTDAPNADKVTVNYKDKPTMMNWQERGHFGTIKPYFGNLYDYVQGLAPVVPGTAEYDMNLREAQQYGSNDMTTKDKYNGETPFFWLHDWSRLPVVWTTIARSQLDPKLSNLETARTFAALGLGVFEACNANYGMKWGHLANTTSLWRPETAIRSGDTFGHTAVAGWTPQLTTPMHPEFPSGHCAHSGAAMEGIRIALGTDSLGTNGVVVSTDWNDHNPQASPIPNRKYYNLTQIEQDVMNARVYGGIHYRSSCSAAWVLAHKAVQSSFAAFFGRPDPNRSH